MKKKPKLVKLTKTQIARTLKKHEKAAKEAAETARALAKTVDDEAAANAALAAADLHETAVRNLKPWWKIW